LLLRGSGIIRRQSRSPLLPNVRKRFFRTSKYRLSPLNFGSFTESIAGASHALLGAQENQGKMPPRKPPSTSQETGSTARKRRRQRADRRRSCTPGVYTAKAIRNES
jgi:hypothetical protein